MSEINRNDPCPCGSGLKYKKCCMNKMTSYAERQLSETYFRKYRIKLKTPEDILHIKEAGKLVVDTLKLCEKSIKPGMTTDEINTLVHEYTIKHGATPAPLNYHGFPKSVCTSINDVICHGIPSTKDILKEGDIVNVDVTSILHGYHADANMTFLVGNCSDDAKKIVNVARESLKRALTVVKPGKRIGDIGYAIQEYAEGQGCSVVRDYIGHGIGRGFHEAPEVPHYGRKNTGIELIPGMVFTIEPMINLGEPYSRVLSDNWTAVTTDGSLSAQFEQTILVTDSGYEVLTPYDL